MKGFGLALFACAALACAPRIMAPACATLAPDERVGAWGNMAQGFDYEERYRQLAGRVVDLPGDPLGDTLVEVFPGCRMEKDWADVRDDPAWLRVAGCRVGKDGVFRFPELPPGEYEIRAGKNSGSAGPWDVTRVCVRVAPGGAKGLIPVVMRVTH
ncbi:MAG: carboxypeptidase regulatory-like domain-containing protein [Polyangiaceae bacterium]|nr:carboxypeptidase regulatory-like domain-containing protein [Polyangiaceae bacterium]